MDNVFSSFLQSLISTSPQEEDTIPIQLINFIKTYQSDYVFVTIDYIYYDFYCNSNYSSDSDISETSDYKQTISRAIENFQPLPSLITSEKVLKTLENLSPQQRFVGQKAELIVDIPPQLVIPPMKLNGKIKVPILVFFWDTQDYTELELTIRGVKGVIPFSGYFLFILDGKKGKRIEKIKINVENSFVPRIWFLDLTAPENVVDAEFPSIDFEW